MRDRVFIERLEQKLAPLFEDIRLHGQSIETIKAIMEQKKPASSKWLLRFFKAAKILRRPSAWPYYFADHKNEELKQYCRNVAAHVKHLKKNNTQVVLLARSAGARIAALMADELAVEKTICIGYPFKHPQHDDEPQRYMHLTDVKTPTIIFQGVDDEYGGSEIELRYKMSKNISLRFVDTDHDFDISEIQWSNVYEEIVQFVFNTSADKQNHHSAQSHYS